MAAEIRAGNISPGNCIDKFYGFPCRGRLALIAFLLFLLFSMCFLVVDPLFRSAADPSLIDLQLCASPLCFQDIIVRWNKSVAGGVEIYKLSIILLDFIYPLVYSTMLALAYAAVRGNRFPFHFDRVAFTFPFGAAIFDYIENALHLFLLKDVRNLEQALAAGYPALLVEASFTCSVLKFFFFCAAILALIGAVFYRAKTKYS
jgi:hypothetical protein